MAEEATTRGRTQQPCPPISSHDASWSGGALDVASSSLLAPYLAASYSTVVRNYCTVKKQPTKRASLVRLRRRASCGTVRYGTVLYYDFETTTLGFSRSPVGSYNI